MTLVVGGDALRTFDRILERAKREQSLAYGQRPRKARVLHERRSAGSEVARRALAEPAGRCLHVRALGDRELGPGPLHVPAGSCRDPQRRRRARPRSSRGRSSTRARLVVPACFEHELERDPCAREREHPHQLVALLVNGCSMSSKGPCGPTPRQRPTVVKRGSATSVANGQSSSTTGWACASTRSPRSAGRKRTCRRSRRS